MSDFLFLVVWSVNCVQYPIPCSLELTVLDIQFLVVVHVHSAIHCCWLLPCESAVLVSCARANEADVTTSSSPLAMLLQLGLCWEVYCRHVSLYFLLLYEEQGNISIVSHGWACNQSG